MMNKKLLLLGLFAASLCSSFIARCQEQKKDQESVEEIDLVELEKEHQTLVDGQSWSQDMQDDALFLTVSVSSALESCLAVSMGASFKEGMLTYLSNGDKNDCLTFFSLALTFGALLAFANKMTNHIALLAAQNNLVKYRKALSVKSKGYFIGMVGTIALFCKLAQGDTF